MSLKLVVLNPYQTKPFFLVCQGGLPDEQPYVQANFTQKLSSSFHIPFGTPDVMGFWMLWIVISEATPMGTPRQPQPRCQGPREESSFWMILLGEVQQKKRIKTIPPGITTLGGIPPIYSYLFHSGNSKGGFKTNPSEKSQDHKHSVQKTTSSIQRHATWLLPFHVMTSKRIHSCA